MRYLLRYLLASCAALYFAAGASAQNYDDNERFKPGSRQTVFADTAYVRSAPGAAAPALDSLFAFETVRILRQDAAKLTLGRKTAPWFRISYTKAGTTREGYLWGGALALTAIRHDGVDIAAGLLSYPDPAAFTSEDSGKELRYHSTFSIKARSATARDEARFNISRESVWFYEQSDTNGVVNDKHWLPAAVLPPDARFMVNFGMSGEACGIPTYSITAAWDGSRLIRLPLLESNADGGEWAYEETYAFRASKGPKPAELRVRTKTMTAIEGSEEMKTEDGVRYYHYNPVQHRFEPVRMR